MFKSFFTIVILIVFALSINVFSGMNDFKTGKVVTAEDEANFMNKLQNVQGSYNFPKLSTEIGRTWYDYACNNISGRISAYAYTTGADGIHFAFMKRQPDQNGVRYATYDYYDLSNGLFYGNQSITEAAQTGWARVINGANDEAIVSHHGGGAHLWQDAGEGNYSFTEMSTVTNGLFPGIAIMGDTVVMISNLDGVDYTFIPNDIQVSTDYMQTWAGVNLWALESGAAEYGPTELWPTFDPAGNMGVLYGPDAIGANEDGQIKWATTSDLGATWTNYLIFDDFGEFPEGTYLPGKTSLFHIQNFNQFNSMYTQDGVYHAVFGAVQGWADTTTSVGYDYHPLFYWNSREEQFVDIASLSKSYPADTSARSFLQATYAGNMLGGLNYPTISEGPNGDLLVVWQEWEDDGTGYPVTAIGTGGTEFPCSDIWGAYSPDGGMSWGEPFFLAGTAGESDVYPRLPKNFYYTAADDSIIIDLYYMWDTNIGTSLFGDSDPSECIHYYERIIVKLDSITTGVGENYLNVLQEFKLSQNYPNPFNPSTNIRFTVDKATDVRLEVFNTIGERIATLVNGKVDAGETIVSFDGSNHSSGVYFYKLAAGKTVETRKMILVK